MSLMQSIRLFALSFLGCMLLVLQACSKPDAEIEQPKIVMVTQAVQDQKKVHSYAGEVQARQQTALAFRVSGQVLERYADVGIRVRVGQVLAKLDASDANLQLNAARAQLEQANAAQRNAAAELKRFQQLLPDNAVSRSQFDAVENQHKAALSNLKQAQANFEVAQNQTRYNQLTANENGVITKRNIEAGQVVEAGQVAYQIAIDGEREVVIGVPEQVISSIKPQQKAWVSIWSNPDQRYEGFVREISPAADQSRTFTVKVALRDRNAPIQLGQSARVFFLNDRDGQFALPLSSISAVDNKPFVWVVQPDYRLKRAWVTLQEYQHDKVPVSSGVNAQQWVVMGGVHLLREGQKVRPVDRDNRPVKIVADEVSSTASQAKINSTTKQSTTAQ